MEIRLAGIIRESIVDGPGLRFTVFVQGCPHHCPGCHNPETHDPTGGFAATTQRLLEEIEKNPLCRGVTLSGGEPFAQPEASAELAEALKARGYHLMIYSGWTYETLTERAKEEPAVGRLLACCDLLVDGPFLLAERDLALLWRGSRNQRLIDVPASREAGEAVEYLPPERDGR